jgi:hypothetical protein
MASVQEDLQQTDTSIGEAEGNMDKQDVRISPVLPCQDFMWPLVPRLPGELTPCRRCQYASQLSMRPRAQGDRARLSDAENVF